jgi:acetyl/propionyl-CoA carboxylase alpha subunit
MVAKLCTWGRDRDEAIRRMRRALDETVVLGITTNIALHHRILAAPEFVAGNYDTGLLGRGVPARPATEEAWSSLAVAAAAVARFEADRAKAPATSGRHESRWATQGRWQHTRKA